MLAPVGAFFALTQISLQLFIKKLSNWLKGLGPPHPPPSQTCLMIACLIWGRLKIMGLRNSALPSPRARPGRARPGPPRARVHLYDLLDVLDLVHELHLCHPPDVLELPDPPDHTEQTQKQQKQQQGLGQQRGRARSARPPLLLQWTLLLLLFLLSVIRRIR